MFVQKDLFFFSDKIIEKIKWHSNYLRTMPFNEHIQFSFTFLYNDPTLLVHDLLPLH